MVSSLYTGIHEMTYHLEPKSGKHVWKVECLCGIGYVYHNGIHAHTKEEAMEHLATIEERECDYYFDHAGGLIEVTNAWIKEYR